MTVNDALGLAFDAVWAEKSEDREIARKLLSDAMEEAGELEKAALARQEHCVYYVTGSYEALIERYDELHSNGADAAIAAMVEHKAYSSPGEAVAFMEAMDVHDGWLEVYSGMTLDDVEDHVRSMAPDDELEEDEQETE